MTLILTQAQALQARVRGANPNRLLTARMLADGTFALSEAALDDQANKLVLATLKVATKRSVSAAEYQDPSYEFKNASDVYELYADRKPWSIQIPATGIERFELRPGDQGFSGDPASVRHRSELSAITRPALGVDIWQAYSFQHIAGTTTNSAICNQWHGSDTTVSRSPAVDVNIGSNALVISTRSDAELLAGNGVSKPRYTAAALTKATWHSLVLRMNFAASGLLQVWLNGSQVVNFSGPVGYYNDARGSYLKYGIYANEQPTVSVMYANMEWGLSDLSARIASPTAIPA